MRRGFVALVAGEERPAVPAEREVAAVASRETAVVETGKRKGKRG